MEPDPKIVVITGAGSGIGRALAHKAANRGEQLVLVGRRQSALEATASELAGPVVDIFPLDVTDAEGCRSLAAHIGARYGRVDVLMNNAGKIVVGTVDDSEPGDVSEMLATNLLGPILMTTTLLPLLRASDSAHIVNIGSMLGDIAMPMFSAYSASKFGLRGWSDGLRRELSDDGIAVTHAAPRATRTGAATAFDHLIKPFSMRLDTPEAVADQVWRAVARGRRTSYPSGFERLARGLQMVAPRIIDRGLVSQLRRVRSGGDV